MKPEDIPRHDRRSRLAARGGRITMPPEARMLLHLVCDAIDRRLPAAV